MKTISKPSAYLFAACLSATGLLAFAGETSPLDSGAGDDATDRPTSSRNYKPASSIEHRKDIGVRAHTHLRVLIPPGGQDAFNTRITANATFFAPPPYPPYPDVFFETPASLGCIYGLTTPVAGCNPQVVTAPPAGGSKAIAVVDAYNYPTALHDLQHFSTQFGLVAPDLTVVYANGVPGTSPGWVLETALDLQWTHAMAPSAKLYLVLAKDNTIPELLTAVDTASALVAAAGGGEVTMSWGSSEFVGESAYDTHFATPNVVYVASAGDDAGVTSWPAVSPNVVGVGGTSIRRAYGNFVSESAYSDTGGGPSLYFSRPAYQDGIGLVGTQRGTPDVALAADPNNGAWVYATVSPRREDWWILGGTSWAAHAFAGIINAANNFYPSSADELTTIYGGLGSANFTDITTGFCGVPGARYYAAIGWDFCTGVGSDVGYVGK